MLATRRRWLQGAWAGSLSGLVPFSAAAARPKQSVYEKLGLRPLINFQGTHTTMELPSSARAFRGTSGSGREYVVLEELQEAIGDRLAALMGTEAAMVSTGAA